MQIHAGFFVLATSLFSSVLAAPTLAARQVLAPPPSDITVTIPDIPLDLVPPALPADLDNVVFDVAASTAKEVSESKASLATDLSEALAESKEDGHQRRQTAAPVCGSSTIPYAAWPAGARGATADKFIGKDGASPWAATIAAASPPDLSKWSQVTPRSDDQYLSYSVGSVPGPTAINTLQSYDPSACAAKCASNKFCRSFGIWIERTPCSATNQEPSYQVKCIQYSYSIQTGDLNNKGQWAGTDGKFYRTQTGVKAYNLIGYIPPGVTGFDRPLSADFTLRVSSASDIQNNWGMSFDILQRDPSTAIPDPNICAKQCADINAAGPVDEVKKSCNAFQLVHLTKTDSLNYQRAYAFICRFFTDAPTGAIFPQAGLAVDSGYFYTATNPVTPSIVQSDPSTTCGGANQRVKTGIWSYYYSGGAGASPWKDADGNDIPYQGGSTGSWYSSNPTMFSGSAPDYLDYLNFVGGRQKFDDRRIAATWSGYPDDQLVDDRFAVEDVSLRGCRITVALC